MNNDQAAEILRLVRKYGGKRDVASAIEATRIATCRKTQRESTGEVRAKMDAEDLFRQIEALVASVTNE